VFTFDNITPAATIDEGHNWLNLTYGPLTLSRPNVVTATAPELMVASATAGANGGAYSILGTSAAVNRGTNSCTSGAAATTALACALTGGVLLPNTTGSDFFGRTRPKTTTNPADVGAVEFQVAAGSTLVVVNPAPLIFNAVVSTTTTQDLTVSNNGTTPFIFTQGTAAGPFGTFTRVAGGTCDTASANPATRTLGPGTSCTIRVQWAAPSAPTGTTPVTGSVAIAGSATVTNSPVTITANAVAATRTAVVSPSPLAFGNWANGTTSTPMNLTVTNTGNSPLPSAGNLSYTLSGSATFTRVTGGTFPAGAPDCGNSLAVGASCTVKVQFAPTSANTGNQAGTLTLAGTGVTFTPASVSLTGTGIAGRAAVTVAPLTITVPTGSDVEEGIVVLTNAAPQGGANLTVSSVGNPVGGTPLTYVFSLVPLQDACTGSALPPGGTCTVGVRFTNVGSPRGRNRTGTISFTSNGTPSPVTGALTGFATP
jgi:hypothetical protein